MHYRFLQNTEDDLPFLNITITNAQTDSQRWSKKDNTKRGHSFLNLKLRTTNGSCFKYIIMKLKFSEKKNETRRKPKILHLFLNSSTRLQNFKYTKLVWYMAQNTYKNSLHPDQSNGVPNIALLHDAYLYKLSYWLASDENHRRSFIWLHALSFFIIQIKNVQYSLSYFHLN